jgi:hypothetical protein
MTNDGSREGEEEEEEERRRNDGYTPYLTEYCIEFQLGTARNAPSLMHFAHHHHHHN